MSEPSPDPVSRRGAVGLAAETLALGGVAMSDAADPGGSPRIVCFIRYQIDPYQKEAFRAYAKAWGRIIPRCGGWLIGYFLPWEGTNDIGWGVIGFPSLAAYETYRQRLRADPEARANFERARDQGFILREERSFLEVVEGAALRPALPAP